MRSLAVLITICLALTGCLRPPPPASPQVDTARAALLAAARIPTVSRTAVSGQEIKIMFFTSLNPDCTSAGWFNVRVPQPPENGRLRIEKTTDYPNYVAGNQRYACNLKKVPGTRVMYRSNEGYLGPDQVQLEGLTESGADMTTMFNITVK